MSSPFGSRSNYIDSTTSEKRRYSDDKGSTNNYIRQIKHKRRERDIKPPFAEISVADSPSPDKFLDKMKKMYNG